MTERRARFRPVDIWSPDDPAQVRLREALALRPPEEPVQTPTPAPVAPDPAGELRTLRDAALRGDRSALERLRLMLGRLRRG